MAGGASSQPTTAADQPPAGATGPSSSPSMAPVRTSDRWMRGITVLLGLVYLVLLGTAWLHVARGASDTVPAFRAARTADGLTVFTVFSGSPAAAAGLGAGDVILAVDGIPASDVPAFDRAYWQPRRPGERYTLRVRSATAGAPGTAASLTEELQLVTQSPLANPGLVALFVTLSVVGLVMIGTGLVVALARPGEPAARPLLLLVSSFPIGMTMLMRVNTPTETWIWSYRAYMLLVALAGTALLHLFLTFPTSHPLLKGRGRGSTVALYALPLALTLGLLAGPSALWLGPFAVAVVLIVLAVLALLRSYWRSPTTLARAQLKWILWAVAIAGSVSIVEVAAILVIGVASVPALLRIMVFGVWVLLPLSIGLGILRYRLFDITVVIRATLVYALLTAGLLVLFLGAVFAFSRAAVAVAGPTAADNPTVIVLATLLAVGLANPARQRLQRGIDRLFYRHRLERARFLEEATDQLGQSQPVEAVAALLTEHATERLGLTGAWLVRPPGVAAGNDKAPTSPLPAPGEALLAHLHDARGLLRVASRAERGASPVPELPAEEPVLAPWHAAGARLLLPLRTDRPAAAPTAASGDELSGIWVVGQRQEALFDRDDVAVLTRVGRPATVLLDNAQLTSELKRDIAARLEAEAALRESEARFRLIAEVTPGPVVITQYPAGTVLYANEALAELFGLTVEEAIGRQAPDFYDDPTDRQRLFDRLARDAAVDNQEIRLKRVDGTPFWAAVSIRRLSFSGEDALFVALHDVTARREAEAALRASEEQYRLLVENHVDGVILTVDGKAVHANPVLCELLGLSLEEIHGRSPVELLAPEDQARAGARMRELFAGAKIEPSEYQALRKDGATIPVEVVSRIVQRSGQPVLLTVVRDIAERKQAQQALQQAQKLEAVGQLAAGIAHEINTPVQYMGDNARFLQEATTTLQPLLANLLALSQAKQQSSAVPAALLTELAALTEAADVEFLPETLPRATQHTLDGVARVAKIVRAMRDFSHRSVGSADKEPTDLARAIDAALTISRNEWKYVAEVVTDLDPGVPLVPLLAGEFNQVLLNLIVNAAHAITEVVGDGAEAQGTITLSMRRDQDWVELQVADTGAGIPEALRERIFEPFFTTKEVGQGTGQGLALARACIVEQHGGTLNVESTVGEGTTFTIRLPLEESPHSEGGSA
ncbi:MAG: hypothetical protein CL878_12410 [Dehalococcoidia bacterium]|nr:hypothetical protein [Dehalococcoidia bacterium]